MRRASSDEAICLLWCCFVPVVYRASGVLFLRVSCGNQPTSGAFYARNSSLVALFHQEVSFRYNISLSIAPRYPDRTSPHAVGVRTLSQRDVHGLPAHCVQPLRRGLRVPRPHSGTGFVRRRILQHGRELFLHLVPRGVFLHFSHLHTTAVRPGHILHNVRRGQGQTATLLWCVIFLRLFSGVHAAQLELTCLEVRRTGAHWCSTR